MKRICSYCQADMGEKCGKCGSLNVHALPIHGGVPTSAARIVNCRTCGNTWEEGSEPASHGICASCSQTVNCQL